LPEQCWWSAEDFWGTVARIVRINGFRDAFWNLNEEFRVWENPTLEWPRSLLPPKPCMLSKAQDYMFSLCAVLGSRSSTHPHSSAATTSTIYTKALTLEDGQPTRTSIWSRLRPLTIISFMRALQRSHGFLRVRTVSISTALVSSTRTWGVWQNDIVLSLLDLCSFL